MLALSWASNVPPAATTVVAPAPPSAAQPVRAVVAPAAPAALMAARPCRMRRRDGSDGLSSWLSRAGSCGWGVASCVMMSLFDVSGLGARVGARRRSARVRRTSQVVTLPRRARQTTFLRVDCDNSVTKQRHFPARGRKWRGRARCGGVRRGNSECLGAMCHAGFAVSTMSRCTSKVSRFSVSWFPQIPGRMFGAVAHPANDFPIEYPPAVRPAVRCSFASRHARAVDGRPRDVDLRTTCRRDNSRP